MHKCLWFLLLMTIKVEARQLSNGKGGASCKAIQNLPAYVADIKAHPGNYIKDKDSCVLSLLDRIAEGAIKTHKESYLDALDAICTVSDGYVSEALIDICKDQFYKNFDLVLRTGVHKESLRHFIVEGLSMEMGTSADRTAAHRKLNSFIDAKIKLQKDKAAIVYLNKIKREVDPKMFD